MRLFTISLILLTFVACAGGSGPGIETGNGASNSFSITPAVPLRVVKGKTLQLGTDPSGLEVTWEVEGGDASGTIDAMGLYQAPSEIPLPSKIVVRARSAESEARTEIQIYTDEAVTFRNARQMSDRPVDNVALLSEVRINQSTGGSADRLAVGGETLLSFGAWNYNDDVNGGHPTQAKAAVAEGLGEFLPELILNTDVRKGQVVNTVLMDQDQNPGVFFSDYDGSQALLFRGSFDQGKTFDPARQIIVPATGKRQFNASAQADLHNQYHVVFVEEDSSASLRFYQSGDGGQTWQKGGSLPPLPNVGFDQTLPNLWVSPDGQDILICYRESGKNYDEIHFTQSRDGGQTFSPALNISQAAGPEKGACRVAQGPNREIVVVYRQGEAGSSDPGDNAEILLKKSTDGGISFGNSMPVHDLATGRDNFLPFLSVDALGRIDVIWNDDSGANDYLPRRILHARSIDGGENFSSPEVIVTSAKDYAFPLGLVHDDGGRLHLQYAAQLDEGNFPYHIYQRVAD